jgi:hypothetical protein
MQIIVISFKVLQNDILFLLFKKKKKMIFCFLKVFSLSHLTSSALQASTTLPLSTIGWKTKRERGTVVLACEAEQVR